MTHAISSGHDHDPDEDPDDATRIIRSDTAGDDATRILPMRAPPPTKETPGTVIGTAAPAAADAESGDDRTVFLPAGLGKPKDGAFDPAVGWLVIVEGPGRGNHCPVFYGQNSIGRGEDQRVRLNFGDARIARESHAFLIYDELAHKFFLRDNGKANLVRINDTPVMAPTEVRNRDRISIGQTVMMFVALCGEDFDWLADEEGPSTGGRA